MSQSMSLALPRHLDLAHLHAIARRELGDLVRKYEDEFQVHRGEEYVRVFLMSNQEAVAEEYFDNDDIHEDLRLEALEKVYVMLIFSGFDLIKQVLAAILRGLDDGLSSTWVDTDYGWVIRGDVFLRNLKEQPNWDWRHPSPEAAT